MSHQIVDFIQFLVGVLCLTAFVLSPAACTMNRHAVIAEAIKGGADPIAAKCAIESFVAEGVPTLCLEYIKR